MKKLSFLLLVMLFSSLRSLSQTPLLGYLSQNLHSGHSTQRATSERRKPAA